LVAKKGSIRLVARKTKTPTPSKSVRYSEQPERIGAIDPLAGITLAEDALAPLHCAYRDDAHGIFLYCGDCLEVLDAIAAKHPAGCFDMIAVRR
jgi:hypothetical protein